MRSDRAQNSRAEALGLIRNRKGHLPHIAVATGAEDSIEMLRMLVDGNRLKDISDLPIDLAV